MTAATLTLTDFLLARIAEDEARMAAVRVLSEKGEAARFTHQLTIDFSAKRRIVEDPYLRLDSAPGWTYSTGGERILSLLALPYADHPDYRDDWRP